MRRSPAALLCLAVCPTDSRIPSATQHTVQCSFPVVLPGREPLSGREYDGVWTVGITLALRIVDDYALDNWLSPDVAYGIDTLLHLRLFAEDCGAPSVTAKEGWGRIRQPTVSDVERAQNLETPLIPTPEYKEHVLDAVCAKVGHELRAQEAGVEVVPSRSSIESVRGPVPSPLHKVHQHVQPAFRHGPIGVVERIPVTAFVLDAIAGSGNLHGESRPVGTRFAQQRTSKELVFSPQLEVNTVFTLAGGLARYHTIDGLLRNAGTSVEEVQAAFSGGGYNRWLLSLTQPQGVGGSGSAADGSMPSTSGEPGVEGTGPRTDASSPPTGLDKAAAKALADDDGGSAPTQV